MKIKVICPITTKEFENDTKEEIKKFISEDVQIDAERIEYGTASIEGI